MRTRSANPRPHRASQLSRSRRAGTIFNFFLMYVFLTGLLISSTGIAVHVVLKSGVAHEAGQQQLRAVSRMEQLLRNDVALAAVIRVDETRLVFDHPLAQSVEWTTDHNHVHRVVTQSGETTARERFVLQRGSHVEWHRRPESFVTVRVVEPLLPGRSESGGRMAEAADSPSVEDSPAERPQAPIHTIEILLPATSADSEVAS